MEKKAFKVIIWSSHFSYKGDWQLFIGWPGFDSRTMQGFLLTQNQYKTLGNHLKNKSYIMNIFAFWSRRQVAAKIQKSRLIQ